MRAKGMRPATTLLRVAFYLSGDPMSYNPFRHQNSKLMIGNHSVSDLARTYQTPLYIMDEAMIRQNIRAMHALRAQAFTQVEFIYASKAFLNLAMAQLIHEEGLSLDVVSGGELHTALKANFPAERIYFHGNNKSNEELSMALTHRVGTIILDNPYEVKRILALKPTHPVQVMLRVNPELTVDTHAYITTGHHDSKFGLSLSDPETHALIKQLAQDQHFDFKGLHIHLGSQLHDPQSFLQSIEVLLDCYQGLRETSNISLPWLNLGGGFGVAYTKEDPSRDVEDTLQTIISAVHQGLEQRQLRLEKLLFEPGRSLVANAGITVYEVQALKTTPSNLNYVFVDGSMADHMRTALYQARYEAALVDRMDEACTHRYAIAGKACESGDILIHDVLLPEVKLNDLICVFSTGAYHYSMSSNYNRLRKPAVLFVHHDDVRVVTKRESYDDLVSQDCL